MSDEISFDDFLKVDVRVGRVVEAEEFPEARKPAYKMRVDFGPDIGIMKTSAVVPERHVIEAPARVFHDQEEVKAAFKAGEFTGDTVVVVRFQGPRANGMPELHSLVPTLAVLQDRGLNVALLTDGRMSGASGKVPAAIHVCPEAADGGPLARIADGDLIRVDAVAGEISVLTPGALNRPPVTIDLSHNATGIGRELFGVFRANAGPATAGAATILS